MVATKQDDDVLGYEVVAGELRPMDGERYRAFLQEGIDSIERDGTLSEDEADKVIDDIIATLRKR